MRPPSTAEEWDAYHELRWRVLRAPWGQPRGSERLEDDPCGIHLMAVSEGAGKARVVGVVCAIPTEPGAARIRSMAVDPEWQGRGIGRRLMEEIEGRARDAGWPRLSLHARAQAVGFYRHLGYAEEGPSFILFESIPHTFMTKRLDQPQLEGEPRSLHDGRWLTLQEVGFRNRQGERRVWESVRRRGVCGAVCVVATTPGPHPSLVVVRQFRPPAGGPVLEFPAGLIEPGETIAGTALRELEEETGFVGDLLAVFPTALSSPGLTDEAVAMARVRITGRTEARPERDESIEVLCLPLADLADALLELERAGDRLDAKLWSVAFGLAGLDFRPEDAP